MSSDKDKQCNRAMQLAIPAETEKLSCAEAAEIMRKKSRYRELILSGRLMLPHRRAAQLLGPDCLYHLYPVSRSESRGKRRR